MKSKKVIIATIYIILVFQLFLFVDSYAVNVLWQDQWDFLKPLFEEKSYLEIFLYQHGPHRQGLAFVLTSLLYKATSWNVRIEAFSMVGLLFITSLLFSFTCARLNKDLSLLDAAIPLMTLSTLFYETLYQTPNASHGIFPLFLLSVIALGQTFAYGVRIFVTTVCGFIALFTGFGFFVGLMVAFWLFWETFCAFLADNRQQFIAYLIAFVVVVGGFYLFFKGYIFRVSVECFHFPHSPIYEYVVFIIYMLGFFGGMHCSLGIIFCRLSLVVGLLQAAVFLPVSVMVLKRFLGIGDPATALTRICFILGGFSALYMASTAIGRVCIATAVQSPRYLPLMTPAYIAFFLFLRTGSPNQLKRCLLITLFIGLSLKALVCSFPFAEISMAPMIEISNKKRLWIESYLETEDLRQASDMSGFKLYPADPMVLYDRMKYLQRRNLTFFQTK